MHTKPIVSVVMPAFNTISYVGKAIESILTQTINDFELIIIDDGSTDDTPLILAEYQKADSRIQVYRQKNSGVAASMNLGCRLAKGKYIARMDADDISLPHRLARQVEFLEQNSDIGICGTWMYTFNDEKKTLFRYPTDPEIAKSTLPFQLSIVGPSIMFVRETYLNSGVSYNVNVGATDDYLFVVELSKYCRLASIPEALYLYRQHHMQITRREEDRQSKFTRQIRLSQLEELDLQPTIEELDIHEAISSWGLIGDKSTLESAERWLTKLQQANATSHIYPEPAFSQVLGNYWFSICLRHAKLGFWIYQKFSQTVLARNSNTSWPQRIKLLAKCIARYDRTIRP
ncbi:MAG: glycosyltransferase family 2 protein [Blastocatellales bacterium]